MRSAGGAVRPSASASACRAGTAPARPLMPLRVRLAAANEVGLGAPATSASARVVVVRIPLDRGSLLGGELHPPADHFGGVQADDRPGWLALRPGRLR